MATLSGSSSSAVSSSHSSSSSFSHRQKDLKALLFDQIECFPPEVIDIIVDYESFEFEGKSRIRCTLEKDGILDLLVISDHLIASLDDSKTVNIWDLGSESGKCVGSWKSALQAHRLAFCANLVVVSTLESILEFYKPITGKLEMTIRGGRNPLPLHPLLPHLPSQVTDAFLCASTSYSLSLWIRSPSFASQPHSKLSGMKTDKEWKAASEERKYWREAWSTRVNATVRVLVQMSASLFALLVSGLYDKQRLEIWHLDAESDVCIELRDFTSDRLSAQLVSISNPPSLLFQRVPFNNPGGVEIYLHDTQSANKLGFLDSERILTLSGTQNTAWMCLCAFGQLATSDADYSEKKEKKENTSAARARVWDIPSKDCLAEWINPFGENALHASRLQPMPNGRLLAYAPSEKTIIELF